MRTKARIECNQPFNVIEDGDEPAEIERGVTDLGAASEICLVCHRADALLKNDLRRRNLHLFLTADDPEHKTDHENGFSGV